MYKQRVTGFTLVELLVVLFVVALLVAIVMPVFMNMRRTGRYNSCMQNLKEVGAALTLYHGDFGRYPAPPRLDYLQSLDWHNLPFSAARKWTVDTDATAPQPSSTSITLDDTEDLNPAWAVGMQTIIRPTAHWTILSKPSSLSLELDSVANLAEGLAVTLTDRDTGAVEHCAIALVDAVNRVIGLTPAAGHTELQLAYAGGGTVDAIVAGEHATIAGIDTGGKVVTFSAGLHRDYSHGGTMEMEPIRVVKQELDPENPKSLRVAELAGLSEGMRIAIYATKPAPGQSPHLIDVPLIDSIDRGTNTLIFAARLQRASFTGNEYVAWAIDNDGLATLYQLYLTDRHSYLRSYLRYHCPTDLKGESIDRARVLAALQTSAPSAETYHAFDPLFGGYNSYDQTYNYDQFDGEIAAFDAEMGYGGSKTNRVRQLANPAPPADTVVCWCMNHNGGQVPVGRVAVGADPAELERQQRDRRNLVLWVDGSVAPVAPYLARDNSGQAYWMPVCLYTRGEGTK